MKKILTYAKDNSHTIMQFIKFNLVGIVNTLIDISVFTLLNKLFGVYYLVAHVISYSTGVLNSYVMNTRWTFKHSTKRDFKEGMKFIAVNVVSFGCATLFIYICKEQMHMGALTSKVIATGASVVVNFIGNKIWVFK